LEQGRSHRGMQVPLLASNSNVESLLKVDEGFNPPFRSKFEPVLEFPSLDNRIGYFCRGRF
jgi:hypothetical protein